MEDWKEQYSSQPDGTVRKNHGGKVAINLLITLIVGLVYFYFKLPALNFKNTQFYGFLFLLCLVYTACAIITSGFRLSGGIREYFYFVKAQCKGALAVALILAIVFLAGNLVSSVIFRASAYRELLQVSTGDFAADVQEISYDRIPMLDKSSAQRLGDRKLGELEDMVSQFEVADNYTQINYNGSPVRVTPLEYGDLIKWFNNRKKGLPAYMVIDMTTQAVDVVRLEEGIKYSPSELFGRKLERYLRFHYPTYMFATPNFEIDDSGNPYWICPRIVKTIGLFGGTDIKGAVMVNAVTGESEYLQDVPSWVDHLYDAELIIEQYDYHGLYKNGFINSIFGQRDVTVTTDGYNYIALNDDVYVYTGITSVGGDQSNVGFILSNQRTKETRYYSAAGAAEYSAVASAEGVVQHLAYKATFPLLLNISSNPTYFMALKDRAELVKMYAMVNVQQYQIVATGTSVAECERAYIKLMAENGLVRQEEVPEDASEGVIEELRSAVLDGTTYYYIRLEGNDFYYVASASENPETVILNPGDRVAVEYETEDTGSLITASKIERIASAPPAAKDQDDEELRMQRETAESSALETQETTSGPVF